LLELAHPQLRSRRQCALRGVARSPLDEQPLGDSAEHLQRMRVLDEPYTAPPFDGRRRLTAWWRHQGDAVNPKRVGRWLRQRGLEAISPQPRLSQPAAGHPISPSRLRGVRGDRGTDVWSADSTYSRLQAGCVSLVAVIAWVSRYVLSWAVSITMDGPCCVEALEHALSQGQPELVNTDQGAQLTRPTFTTRRQAGGLRIRMDGRGRALDNVFVERLWRSVRYEAVYLRD
jgi:putative transposase